MKRYHSNPRKLRTLDTAALVGASGATVTLVSGDYPTQILTPTTSFQSYEQKTTQTFASLSQLTKTTDEMRAVTTKTIL